MNSQQGCSQDRRRLRRRAGILACEPVVRGAKIHVVVGTKTRGSMHWDVFARSRKKSKTTMRRNTHLDTSVLMLKSLASSNGMVESMSTFEEQRAESDENDTHLQ